MVHTLLKYEQKKRCIALLSHLKQLFDPLQLHVVFYQVSHLGGEVIGQDMPDACYLQYLSRLDLR